MYRKPELLSPAGSFEKLRVAFAFGADAVYVGGTEFGLRKSADNFSLPQLRSAIDYANDLGKKVYLVLNGFAHNEDTSQLPEYLSQLNQIRPHAFIVSDIGVARLAKTYAPDVPIHVSTQASVTNRYTAKMWKDQGAERVIVARELSIEECAKIQEYCTMEVEVFVHGSMCASYSGKCVISNYTAGRDSNRGGCIHSCRHSYEIKTKDIPSSSVTTHIMNARDLMAVNLIPNLIRAGIASLKIEGRMKSNMYLANATAVYRRVIDQCYEAIQTQQPIPEELFSEAIHDLQKVSNRTFKDTGLSGEMDESIYYEFGGYQKDTEYLGTVKHQHDSGEILIEVKSPFSQSDSIQILTPTGNTIDLGTYTLTRLNHEAQPSTHPNMLVKLEGTHAQIPPLSVVRKSISSECRV